MTIRKVRDYTVRNVVTVRRATPVKDIAKLFLEHNIDFLPVVDKDNHLLGVITKKDILAPFLPDYFDLLDDIDFISDFGFLESSLTETLELLLVADDVMIRKVVTIEEEASLLKAVALIHQHKVRHLPVVRDNQLVGVISRTDLIRALFDKA